MANSKQNNSNRLNDILLFIFFIIFPFGQLLSIGFNISGKVLYLHFIDIVIALSSFIYLYRNGIKKIHSKVRFLFIYYLFTLIISLERFGISNVIIGFSYTIKFFLYITFLYFISDYSQVKGKKILLLNCFLLISVISSIFGWIQYILYPNLGFLKVLGWDEHLYRLSGSLLDPNFIGLIIVFGIFLVINKLSEHKSNFLYVLLFFLVISLSFTYSRSSYLAFLTGLFFFFKKNNLKKYIALLIVFLVLLTVLPRKMGEGVKLERLSSIRNRIDYFEKSVNYVTKYPLFGLGFNNLCFERLKSSNEIKNINSKACSGTDSSLLLIIITTGLVGMILFFDLIKYFINNIGCNYTPLFNAFLSSFFIHSIFVNSMFYSWILGFFIGVSGILVKFNNRKTL